VTSPSSQAHWPGWANSIAEQTTVSSIVFLQLGSSYLATADVLSSAGFVLVDADAFLDGEDVEGNLVVLTDLDALSSPASAARMGKLRMKVHAEVKAGRRFVLQSRAPRLIYASRGSLLAQDATFATGPSRSSWADPHHATPVFEAELDETRPFRTVLRQTLTELGVSVCARLDRLVYESGNPAPGVHELDATEVEALRGAGLVDSVGGWQVEDLAAVLRRELTDVLDEGRDGSSYLSDVVVEFDALTSALRRTVRAAARARWGPSWASECLPEAVALEVVKRASSELAPMVESIEDIRDALAWLSAKELLGLRRESALGGLGMSESMWKAAERELAAVEDRLRFFGHLTRQDEACVKKWSGWLGQKLSHTSHLSPDSGLAIESANEGALLRQIRDGLLHNPAFSTASGAAFMQLVTSTLRFLRLAADHRAPYTRPFPKGKAPLEAALQEHYFWYLGATGLGDSTFMEVPNISTGRVDVLVVGEGGKRFVTEVKRELSDASFPAIADAYFGQAADYHVNSDPLGQLLVLDLTDHSEGVPAVANSISVETRDVGGSLRSIVIYVVRGNRPEPSATKSPRPVQSGPENE
jgi:hypothetical protein